MYDAWFFDGNNGNLNNNNVNNGNQVQGAANLSNESDMLEDELFTEQMNLVFDVQKNKRRGRDSLIYENHIIPLTLKGTRDRMNRTLRIKNNYAFLVSLPSWREIMATEFEGRKIDHEICNVVLPLADKVLSHYTFNNRVGKGSQAAINQLIEHIYTVTEGYTKPARCIKIDFKGYFPNALWDYAEEKICEIIRLSDLDEDRKNYLCWLTMIAVQCNPVAHCELRTPKHLWYEHIPHEKSVFYKPEGIGGAIGRLIWQTAMGLYINDIVIWLNEECGILLICFVDDIVMVVPEEQHEYVLGLLPELRKRLAVRNVVLNEKKFYDQPYQHGLEFLGSHIKPYRIHLNNRTMYRAKKRVDELNSLSYKDIDAMVRSFNSYSGLLKNRTDYNRLIALKDRVGTDWWNWLMFNDKRLCLGYKSGWSINERLNRKYNLNIKKYNHGKEENKILCS